MSYLKDVYLSFNSVGEYSKRHYSEIADYQKVMASHGMPDLPELWGMKNFWEAKKPVLPEISVFFEDVSMQKRSSDEDAYIVCSTNAGDPQIFLTECNKVLAQVCGARAVQIFYLSPIGCTNIFNAIELGMALLNSGRRSVFIVASDVGSKYESRLTNHALFSDYCCIIELSRDENLPFKLHAISSISNLNQVADSGIDSFDAINKDNFERVNRLASASEVSAIYPMNNFKPITLMKYKKLGFPQDIVYSESIAERGHCGGADPFMSMVEDPKEYSPDAKFMLNAQTEGKSSMLIASRNR